MLRKVGLVSALLLAIPAFANAWTVTAKIGSGAGTVVSGALTIAKPVVLPAKSYIGYYKVANEPLVADQTFTVDPAAGYSISSVIVNGAAVVPAVDGDGVGTVVVAAGTPIKNSQTLVAYFKQNLLSVDVTQTTGGKVTLQRLDAANNPVGSLTMGDLANLKPGTKVRVTAMPNADFKVVSINGIALTGTVYAGDVKSTDITVTADTAATAVFAQVATVAPGIELDKYIVNPGGSVVVTARSTANVTGVTYAFTTSATDAVITAISATQASIKFPTAGNPTVTVTATATAAGGDSIVPISKLVKVEVNNACMTCHNNRNATLVANWKTGMHGGATGHLTGNCQRCHASEGAIAASASGWTGSYTNVLSNATATLAWNSVKPATSTDGISCVVCHNNDPHDATAFRSNNTHNGTAAVVWDPNGNGKVDQFDMCTSCHTMLDNAGALTDMYHEKSSISVERMIADSHYDNPATLGDSVTVAGVTTLAKVEGYVVRTKGASACADCHNVHSADITIQEAWANSAHAGKIAAKKDVAARAEAIAWFNLTYPTNPAYPVDSADDTATVGTSTRTVLEFFMRNAAGVTFYKSLGATDDADGNAWSHYNWDKTLKPGTGAAAGTLVDDRGACQHCHTATGASNYLKAAAEGTVYDAKNNDFSHLSGWTSTAGSPQQELMYCWGCHKSVETGALITTGPITLDYKVAGATTQLTAADGGKSAACISCHSGRGNSDTLLGTAVINPLGAAISSPATKSHYLAAGLTINQAVVKAGYTFGRPTADYADKSYYAHKTLGCAECHMTGAESHSFEVVGKDTAGVITSVASTKCVECHDGEHGYALTTTDLTNAFGTFTPAGAAAFLQEEEEGYHGALEALKAALIAKGLSVTDGYPYVGGTFANQGVSGAAYNYSYLHHEPGAYAHNMVLAKRLIFDSLDWLDNYIIDSSVAIDATANPHAAAWFGAPAGTTGSYTPVRP